MKKSLIFFCLLFIFGGTEYLFGQFDSLVSFTDLKYHSDFEEKAIFEYVVNNQSPFELYLAIDESMDQATADYLHKAYSSVFTLLEKKKVADKKPDKKVRLTYSIVHNHFLNKYVASHFFPTVFRDGTYNCVSASMLYSLVFNELGIPYKVMASTSHVYLVANPGTKSIVIETTNPTFEDQLFTGEYKQSHVNYLRSSKMISEEEIRSKSVEEIFEAQFNEVSEVQVFELPGVQYYNKAYTEFYDGNIDKAYELAKKALFFFRNDQVEYLLSASLLLKIEKSKFDKVEDIDMISQFSKLKSVDNQIISGLFQNIINHHQQYTDKREFCDSLYNRLISKIYDPEVSDEINFNYNMQMAYHYSNSDFGEAYLLNALQMRNNHKDMNQLLQYRYTSKLGMINDPDQLLEEIISIREKAPFESLVKTLLDYEMLAYTMKVKILAEKKKIKEAESYIQKFVSIWPGDFSLYNLENSIAGAYRSVAIYYYYKGYKTKAKEVVAEGLKYVPNSNFLKSVVN